MANWFGATEERVDTEEQRRQRELELQKQAELEKQKQTALKTEDTAMQTSLPTATGEQYVPPEQTSFAIQDTSSPIVPEDKSIASQKEQEALVALQNQRDIVQKQQSLKPPVEEKFKRYAGIDTGLTDKEVAFDTIQQAEKQKNVIDQSQVQKAVKSGLKKEPYVSGKYRERIFSQMAGYDPYMKDTKSFIKGLELSDEDYGSPEVKSVLEQLNVSPEEAKRIISPEVKTAEAPMDRADLMEQIKGLPYEAQQEALDTFNQQQKQQPTEDVTEKTTPAKITGKKKGSVYQDEQGRWRVEGRKELPLNEEAAKELAQKYYGDGKKKTSYYDILTMKKGVGRTDTFNLRKRIKDELMSEMRALGMDKKKDRRGNLIPKRISDQDIRGYAKLKDMKAVAKQEAAGKEATKQDIAKKKYLLGTAMDMERIELAERKFQYAQEQDKLSNIASADKIKQAKASKDLNALNSIYDKEVKNYDKRVNEIQSDIDSENKNIDRLNAKISEKMTDETKYSEAIKEYKKQVTASENRIKANKASKKQFANKLDVYNKRIAFNRATSPSDKAKVIIADIKSDAGLMNRINTVMKENIKGDMMPMIQALQERLMNTFDVSIADDTLNKIINALQK